MKKTTKKTRKWLSMFLAVILTVGIIPVNVIAEDGQTLDMTLPPNENSIAPTGTADASSGLVEDESRRDAFTKHYVDADGTYYAVVFSEQVHYEDNGRWKEVDNTLDYDSANKKYTAAGDRFGVGFADKASANELVSISDGEHTLSWTISFADAGVQRAATGTEKVTAADVSVQLTNRADNVNEIKTKENIGKMGKAVSGVRYNGVFKNSVDLRYSVLHGKIEEDVILNSPEGFSSYMLTVNTGGLTAVKQSDNSVAFVNTQGETIFTIGAPWMKDANAAVSSNIEVAVMQKGNTAYISYTPDRQWLIAGERAYPVLIDPSFTTRYYTSNYVDTYVMEGDSSAAARASEETLKVGNYDGYPCYAYIKILNIPDFDDTVSITGASFDFWTYGTSTPALDLYEVTGSWTPSSMSYMNQPAADLIVGNKTGTVNEDNAKYSFNITSWVNDIFYTYGYVNSYFDGSNWKGFKVEYTNEVTNNYLEILSSENMDYADCRPTMTIQYRYFPFDGIEDGAVYSFKNASSSKYLTVYGGNTANSTNVIQSTSDNSRSQAFRLDETSNGGYLLRAMCSSDGAGSVLDFNYPSTIVNSGYDPENVRLYSYSSGRAPMQEWLIEAVGSNMCKIVSRADPNLALTAYGSSNGTSSGTTATSAGNVFVSEYTGASNQHWYVYSGGMPVRPDQYNIKDQDTYTISVGSSWLSFCYPVTNYGDTVTLTSSNSYAVSINGTTGNVTPLLAGWATINAKINGTVVDQVTVYSRLDDGLYAFNGEANSSYWIGYDSLDSVDEGDSLKVKGYEGSVPSERNYIFKLKYLGNGKYSVRSMLSSDMGWTCSDTAFVSEAIESSDGSIKNESQWYINADYIGNYIYNSSTSHTVTSTSTDENIALQTYSALSTPCHWNIHEVSGSYHGVDVRAAGNGVAVGETIQMSANVYSSYTNTNSQTPITWSVTNGTGSATINSSTGELTGVSRGTVTVTATYRYNVNQQWSGSCTVNVVKKAIIIVPGIMCSQIFADGTLNTFSDGTRLWDPTVGLGLNDKIGALACNSSGVPLYSTRVNEPTINEYDCTDEDFQYGSQDMYRELYNTLYDNFYNDNCDIVLYEYDWREDPYDTAVDLSSFIEEMGYGSVTFVSHSMGGLVSSYYISLGLEQRNLVDKHISIGTPYLGSCEMPYLYVTGNIRDVFYENWFISESLVEIAYNIPSIYALFPFEQNWSPYLQYRYEPSGNRRLCMTFDETMDVLSSMMPNWNDDVVSNVLSNRDRLFVDNGEHITEQVDSYYIVGVGKQTSYLTCGLPDNLANPTQFNGFTLTKNTDGDGTVTKYSATVGETVSSDKVYYKTSSSTKTASHVGMITGYDSDLDAPDLTTLEFIVTIINDTVYEYTPSQLSSEFGINQ